MLSETLNLKLNEQSALTEQHSEMRHSLKGVNSIESTPDISVIIVSWNTRDLLRDCLLSIAEHTHRYSYEILVVDNNSQDGTVDMIREEFPEVKLIANGFNAGFARANNQALRYCKGRYVAALNPDTRLLNNAFDQMIDFLDQSPDYGAAGPKLLLPSGETQSACARQVAPPLSDDCKIMLGLRRMIKPAYDFELEADVEAISGACIVVQHEILNKKQEFFPEDYFMFGEDLDLCWQINRSGYAIRFIPSAHVLHIHGASSKKNVRALQESFFAMYQYRKMRYGKRAAAITRLLAVFNALLRVPKGGLLWLGLSEGHDGKKYMAEHTLVLLWALGFTRGVGKVDKGT